METTNTYTVKKGKYSGVKQDTKPIDVSKPYGTQSEVPSDAYSEYSEGDFQDNQDVAEDNVANEMPAFILLTVDSFHGNGGIESPFVSNKKYMAKYSLSQEVI